MVVKEWKCEAHGEFDGPEKHCVDCGHGDFVVQEIRTAPAFRRKNMKVIDETFRMIADDHGLTDLKNDVKSGESVLQRMQKLPQYEKPRWGEVPHAQPGFSTDENISVPKIKAADLGFTETTAGKLKMPPMRHDGTFNNPLVKTTVHGHYKE